MRVSFKSILAAAALGAITLSASAAPITVQGVAPESGFGFPTGVQGGGVYPLTGGAGDDFTGPLGAGYNQLTSITQLTVTLSIFDGDSDTGEYDFNNLTLGLDGIDTGLALNGFQNNQIASLTIDQIPVPTATALLAALQDGRLVGTVIDSDADVQVPPDFIGFPADVDTFLDGTSGRGPGRLVLPPLPQSQVSQPQGIH
jgi:hypothetical protein